MKFLMFIFTSLIAAGVSACPYPQNIADQPVEDKIGAQFRNARTSPRAPWPRSVVHIQFAKPLNSEEIVSCFGGLIEKVDKINGDTALVWMYVADSWPLSRYSLIQGINTKEAFQKMGTL